MKKLFKKLLSYLILSFLIHKSFHEIFHKIINQKLYQNQKSKVVDIMKINVVYFQRTCYLISKLKNLPTPFRLAFIISG